MSEKNSDIDYDKEIEQFPKEVRKYLLYRSLAIYTVVALGVVGIYFMVLGIINLFYNVGIPLLTAEWQAIYRGQQNTLNFLWLLILIPLSIIGLNFILQWWSRFYPIPYVLLERIKQAGFILKRPRLFYFFRRTRVCVPKRATYFKVGVRVRYFPFLELKYGCKITVISKELCEVNDSLLVNVVKQIAEKNFISFEHEKDLRDKGIKIKKKKGKIRFIAVCNPEEAISQMMQMGKAIREFEDAKERLVKIAMGESKS